MLNMTKPTDAEDENFKFSLEIQNITWESSDIECQAFIFCKNQEIYQNLLWMALNSLRAG